LYEIIQTSPLVKFTTGVINKAYKDDALLISIIQAMALKHDKEERGVGLRNMSYAPDLVEFAQILYMSSATGYEHARKNMALPNVRTLRYALTF
jgi:hypothetical protein